MKRSNIFSLLTIALLSVVIGLTGCDDGGDSDSVSSSSGLPGTWSLNGATVTAALVSDNSAVLEAAGVDVSGNTATVDSSFLSLIGISATLIIDDDNTWALSATVPSISGYVDAGTYAAEGTYTTNDGRATFTVTTVPAEAAGLVTVGDSYTISYDQSGDALNLSASSGDLGISGVSGSFDFTR